MAEAGNNPEVERTEQILRTIIKKRHNQQVIQTVKMKTTGMQITITLYMCSKCMNKVHVIAKNNNWSYQINRKQGFGEFLLKLAQASAFLWNV